MELETVILSKVTQAQKDKYHILTHRYKNITLNFIFVRLILGTCIIQILAIYGSPSLFILYNPGAQGWHCPQ